MQRLRYQDILAMFIGGCFGGIACWEIGLWLNDADTMLGTTAMNLIGRFLLEFVTYGLAVYIDLLGWLILALGTGFVGAFTTFSTMVPNLYKNVGESPVYEIRIFLLELLVGLGAAFSGYLCAEAWGRRRQTW